MPQNNKLTTFYDCIFDTYICDDAISPPYFYVLEKKIFNKRCLFVYLYATHLWPNLRAHFKNIY